MKRSSVKAAMVDGLPRHVVILLAALRSSAAPPFANAQNISMYGVLDLWAVQL